MGGGNSRKKEALFSSYVRGGGIPIPDPTTDDLNALGISTKYAGGITGSFGDETDAQRDALLEKERLISGDSFESVYFIYPDGSNETYTSGEGKYVTFPSTEIKGQRGSLGGIAVHNHPSPYGAIFSSEDLRVLAENNITQFRVVDSSGHSTAMTFTPDKLSRISALADAYDLASDSLYNTSRQFIRDNKPSIDAHINATLPKGLSFTAEVRSMVKSANVSFFKAQSNFHHKWFQENASKYGYTYRTTVDTTSIFEKR